jgi:NAD(P)-dependent dehydrogenase (short-subunit alcohol dehydrogenase family)
MRRENADRDMAESANPVSGSPTADESGQDQAGSCSRPLLAQGSAKGELDATSSRTDPGTPEDVAQAALLLASDNSEWISGIVIDVAGGSVLV